MMRYDEARTRRLLRYNNVEWDVYLQYSIAVSMSLIEYHDSVC